MTSRECESIKPLISAFMDGELDLEESARLHQHLASCDDCFRLFEEYRELHDTLQRLPAAPPPPPGLRDEVWARTVEDAQHPRLERWLGLSRRQMMLSSAAALVVLVLAAGLFVVQGYQRGITPAIAGSSPSALQEWEIHQPIRINFNKPMNHESVIGNMLVRPDGEMSRLPKSWDDNTLILGADENQSAVLIPDANYVITVLPDAQDQWGNRLGQTWTLAFHTGAVSTAAEVPTPVPTTTATATATTEAPSVAGNIQPTPSPTASQTTASNTPSPTASTTATPTSTATPVPPASNETATPSGDHVGPIETSDPEIPTQPAATSTPTPLPTATGTPIPTATPAPSPTPTSTPIPTGTPVSTPSSTATPLPGTPEPVPVTAAFGSVYWANESVQTKLGAPLAPEYVVNASELGFQRGMMYERFDKSWIYIMRGDGSWSRVNDTWTSADGDGGGPGPSDTLWVPSKGFGQAWSADATLVDQIGYATSPAAHVMTDEGRVQDFENGLMLYSDQGFVYVLYTVDSQWELYPDTSGQGSTITPTPEPSEPTVTPTTEPTQTATPPADSDPTATPPSESGGTDSSTPAPSSSTDANETPTTAPDTGSP